MFGTRIVCAHDASAAGANGINKARGKRRRMKEIHAPFQAAVYSRVNAAANASIDADMTRTPVIAAGSVANAGMRARTAAYSSSGCASHRAGAITAAIG